MSQYYYETQRKEDVFTLQAMFDPPWTSELLEAVLDYYRGHVDEAIDQLLMLESNRQGDPTPLVDMLTGSKQTTRQAELMTQSPVGTLGEGTVAQLPQSNRKKPPSPRKSKIVVTLADREEPTTISMVKQTRRRLGTPTNLPKNFLRIPKKRKNPLFNPKTLESLKEMPVAEPTIRRPSTLKPAKEATPAQTKSQASRISPSDASCPKSDSNNTKRWSRLGFVQEDSCGSRASAGNASNVMSKIILPNVFPKITQRIIGKDKIDDHKATPLGPQPPPMEVWDGFSTSTINDVGTPNSSLRSSSIFSQPKENGQWFAGTEDARATPLLTFENDLLSVAGYGCSDGTYPPPEAAPPRMEETKVAATRSTLPSLTSARRSTNPDVGNDKKKRWSVPSVKVPSFPRRNASYNDSYPSSAACDSRSKWAFPRVATPNLSFANKLKTASYSVNTATVILDPLVVVEGQFEEDTYRPMPQVEFRGVTIRQLQQMMERMHHQCVDEQWKSVETGIPLQPRHVTVYDLVKHFILPQTKATSCSFVEQAFGKHNYEQGLPCPPKWFVSHSWNDRVVDLVKCIEKHGSDHGLEGDDTAKYWLAALGINQHKLGGNVMADLDTLNDDSMLQDPRMTQRVLQVTDGMLCVVDANNTFFSRIWCLWECFLALERSKAGASVEDDRYLLDVYTLSEDGTAVGITDGVANVDKYRRRAGSSKDSEEKDRDRQRCNELEWSEQRVLRQSQFRYEACFEAIRVQLESSNASLESDASRIMNCIVQRKSIDNAVTFHRTHDAEALTIHSAYSDVNGLIQGTFAGMAYRRALEDSVNDEEDGRCKQTFKSVQLVLSASPITKLEISFAGCKVFHIREALNFVECLPSSLRYLDLDYSFLEFQFAEEFAIGLSRLGETLEVFKLNCGFCSRLSNLDRLWEEVGKLTNLRHLALVIHPNKALTSVDGLTAALNRMPKLEILHLDFDCFGDYSTMVAMAKGETTMKSVSSIFRSSDSSRQGNELSEQFDKVLRLANMDVSGNYISDSSIQKLCRSIKSRMFETKIRSLKLRFLGDLGKKLKSVETVEDLARTLQRIRDRLKLFA